ncbi:MAG: BACON domain-containing carbohydrate-binding protein [Bacteroidota bacterium]
MKTFFLSAGLFLISVAGLQAQFLPDAASGDTASYPYWVQMMQDPTARFRDTQHAFEKYWEGRGNYRHNGWKVFKRWEYINQDCVQPDGKLPAPGQVMDEYTRYFISHDAVMSANGNWSLVGPAASPGNATGQPNGLGRINAICLHPVNPNTFYIGSPSGGLWRTTDGAATWSVLTTSTPTLGVSSVLLHPTNAGLILIGTGDRDASDAPGMGVYRSTDGGTTWIASNSGMGNLTVGMMIMHPSDPNIILAAASGGIYKSTDGGINWSRKSSNTNNYKDIRFKPGDPSIVYATEGGKFYRSVSTGDSWTQITAGVITGTRLVIGVSPNQPAWVYLVQTNGPFAGLLRSTDSGLNFTTQSTTPNIMDYACDGSGTSSQAWYDLCIAVDPNNAGTLYVGGVNIWKSANAGVSWTINTHWVGSSWGTSCAPSVHADIHCLEWSPANGNLFTGCDGGIYRTLNGGTSWSDLSSGLAISQVYRIGQSAIKQTLTMNGYQDNGTSKNTGPNFTTVIGGDGMECIVDYSDTTLRYGSIYYGNILRSTGGGYSTIAANGSNGITEAGAWVTPYILHETIPSTMFAGYVNVWRTTNVKASSPSAVAWTKISAGETGTCSVLEQSPANVDILYVVRSSSLKRSDNANAASPSWTACALPGGATPSDLEAHPTDANIIYASAGTKIYKSTDKGATWTNISGSLPAVNINCLVYDKNTNEGLYAGNKTNVFYKDATFSDWVAFSTGLPPVDVRELEIFYDAANPVNNRLKAATYGRGLWQSDLYSLFAVAPANQNVAYTGGITSFSVTANSSTSWTVSSNATWCTVNPSGSGNGTISANYTDNPGISARVASITATPSGAILPQTVTVTQAGAPPALTVTPPNQNVASQAGTTNFTVACNTDWTVSSNANWCTTAPSGSGNGTIVASFTENLAVTGRSASITVTVASLPPQTVTVTQAGAAPTLTVMPPNQIVPSPAGATNFTVTSNTDWIAVSNAGWCSVTPAGTGNGVIAAAVLENLTIYQRVAAVTVSVNGLAPVTVTVTQDGAAPLLAVTPPNQDVPAAAGTTSFTVTSNTTWSASCDAGWCVITSAGSGNGVINADYSGNLLVTQRVAHITVSVSAIASITVTVTQNGALPSLSVAPSGRNVSPLSGTTDFTVTSNTDWTVTADSAWCVPTPAGTGNGTIIVNYSENPYYFTRVSTIAVTVSGLSPQFVTVTQAQSVVSTPGHTAGGIGIYPNPTTGKFRITMTGNQQGGMEVKVIDYTGNAVCTRICGAGSDCIFDLASLPQGCYLVRIQTNGDFQVRKLVIIR